MKDRQRVEHHVGQRQVEAGIDLGDIGEDVGVRQRHALRRALRARGEEDDRRIVRLAPVKRAARRQRCAQFVHPVALARTSSSQTIRADRRDRLDQLGEIALLDKGARGEHERDLAISQAAMRFVGPAVKFSIAGTRPAACSAMKVTAEPLAFGRSRPTISPGWEMSAIFRASTATPMRNMRKLSAPPSGSWTADCA